MLFNGCIAKMASLGWRGWKIMLFCIIQFKLIFWIFNLLVYIYIRGNKKLYMIMYCIYIERHAYQTLKCSTSGWILIRSILKTTALWRKSKIGKCHATTYGFLRLWLKYELRTHIDFSHDKYVPVEFWYTYFPRNVNLTKRENFLTSNLYHKLRNIRALSRREKCNFWTKKWQLSCHFLCKLTLTFLLKQHEANILSHDKRKHFYRSLL